MYWLIRNWAELSMLNIRTSTQSNTEPIGTYRIKLEGSARVSQVKTLQRLQSKALHIITNLQWYYTLRRAQKFLYIASKVQRMTSVHNHKLSGHPNDLVQPFLKNHQFWEKNNSVWTSLKSQTIIFLFRNSPFWYLT